MVLPLVRGGLPEPEVNGEIYADGRLLAQPDLLYRDAKVAIEYDGEQHFADARQRAHDIERDERLRALGRRTTAISRASSTMATITALWAYLAWVVTSPIIGS